MKTKVGKLNPFINLNIDRYHPEAQFDTFSAFKSMPWLSPWEASITTVISQLNTAQNKLMGGFTAKQAADIGPELISAEVCSK